MCRTEHNVSLATVWIMQGGEVIFSSLWDVCHKHCIWDSFHYPLSHARWIIHRKLGFKLTLAVPQSHSWTCCPVLPLCRGLSSSLMTNAARDRLPAAPDTLRCFQSPRATCFTSLNGHILSIFTVLEGIYNAWAACRWELGGYFWVIDGGVLHIHSRQH